MKATITLKSGKVYTTDRVEVSVTNTPVYTAVLDDEGHEISGPDGQTRKDIIGFDVVEHFYVYVNSSAMLIGEDAECSFTHDFEGKTVVYGVAPCVMIESTMGLLTGICTNKFVAERHYFKER